MSALIIAEEKNNMELKTKYQKMIIDSIINSGYNLKNLDDFNVLINDKIKSILSATVLAINPIDSILDRLIPFDIERVVFLYLNYEFMERHIHTLITSREGIWYCTDKTSWILEKYKEYILTGQIPEMGTEEKFWMPGFGEFSDWADYCNSLFWLYHGNPAPYMEAYQRLLNCEMRSDKEEEESFSQEDGGVLQ